MKLTQTNLTMPKHRPGAVTSRSLALGIWRRFARPCLALCFLALPTGSLQAQASCDDDRLARLNFWLGEWEVLAGDRLAGTNRITRVLDGCAVLEEWQAATGGKGRSLFYLSPEDRRWRQVWVTAAAFAAGGVKEKREVVQPDVPAGGIRFEGTVRDTLGRAWLDRTTLAPLPDGSVRQHIEISTDGGASWRTTFDARYRRPVRSSTPGDDSSTGQSPAHTQLVR